MEEETDFLGAPPAERADILSGIANIWEGIERRHGRRWYEMLSAKEMSDLLFLHTVIEEVISFSAGQYSVSEDQGSVTVTFIRERPRAGMGIDFEVVTQPITAVPDLNYLSSVTGPITFLAGQTSINRTISILNANLGAGVNKTFRVKIWNPAVRGAYNIGATPEAVVTINGVGAMSQNGVIQFSDDSVSIREDAGTDVTTVQVTRMGSVSPGAASVAVTSTPGSAVSPSDFSVVSSTLNWASGDATPKPVPVSVVNNPTSQGDRTFQLGLSAPTGGVTIGTVKTQTVSIIDITAPQAAGAYPLRAGYHISDPHDISSSEVLDKMQMEDFVIYGTLPNRAGGIASYNTDILALKARNPGIRVYLYWDPVFLKRNIGPFGDNLLAYMRSQTGVPGLGVSPNQWILQDSSGSQPMNPSFGGCPSPYFHANAVADSQGRRCWAYTMQYLKENILDIVSDADGIFIDDFLHRPVDWTGSVVWQGNNLNVSANDESRRVSFRSDQLAGVTHFKTLTSKRILGNIGGWVLSSTNVVPDMAALQLDGGILENRFGTPLATYGLDVQGTSVISNGNGSFSIGMARANHALYATQNFRLRPPEMVFVCNGMTAANRAGVGKSAGYRYARYCMGCCWICTDTSLHLHDKTGGYSYGGSPNVMAEYDEYFGDDTQGFSVAQKFGMRKWMGLPLDPKQISQSQSGCYRRRWENCLGWMNPQGNGTKTITIEDPGVGKVWRLISGNQDPSVNTGAVVNGSYTLQDQDAVFLKRVDS